MYSLTSNPSVVKINETNSMISQFSSPDAWAEYESWLTQGNTPIPFQGDIVSLDDVKSAKIDDINNTCEKMITSGFVSSALNDDHFYDSKIEDQINLIGAVIAAGAGISIEYRCYRGNNVDCEKVWLMHTPQQMQQVYMDGLTFKATQLRKATYFKTLVENASTIEEVELIEWQ